jgi:hypothetical protein
MRSLPGRGTLPSERVRQQKTGRSKAPGAESRCGEFHMPFDQRYCPTFDATVLLSIQTRPLHFLNPATKTQSRPAPEIRTSHCRRRVARRLLQSLPRPRDVADHARDAVRRTDHVWSIGELIDAAVDGELPSDSGREFPMNLPRDPMPQQGKPRLSVIDGGKA